MSPSNNFWSWNERSIGWSLMGDPNAEEAVLLIHGFGANTPITWKGKGLGASVTGQRRGSPAA